MVVSPPYGITTRLDWPRLNSESLCQVKKLSLLCSGYRYWLPVTVHDTIVCNDRHAIREGGFSPEGSASALVLDTINSAEAPSG